MQARTARFWRVGDTELVGIKAYHSGPNEIHQPVTPEIIKEFPNEYAAFKRTCPTGQCIFGGHMSANAANRVKDAVERVVTSLEKAADDTAGRLNKLTADALDKFNRVEHSVSDPLEQALKGLDELLGTNGGPPLDK